MSSIRVEKNFHKNLQRLTLHLIKKVHDFHYLTKKVLGFDEIRDNQSCARFYQNLSFSILYYQSMVMRCLYLNLKPLLRLKKM